ncbi:ABC transporter ATP-binding protein [Halorubellus sp. PRR65]|uniref:ABC transporter ATP-binding protein n=1 Tax=Halorubellus sp. PRR65 TaxID=3098148 RepID=UPI002B25B59D|nr:ABC transporter ATP-binding protein [Halorubellus sp. PRR65]
MTDLAIDADGLGKRYGETVAVRDVSLAVERGSVYGFLGPNGAGKTTTMRMLTTLTRPTSGSATVAGESVRDRAAVTEHLGYLPEEPPVYDELTGREQLSYVAGLRDLPEDAAGERIDALLARFDLADAADRRVGGYSTGMRQKLGVIQSVLHEPEVVFLDEPTSGLDPRAARTMRETIADLAARDMTVFLSTHVLSVVDELADEVGVLFEGELVAEGSRASLKSRAAGGERTLESAFMDVTTPDDAAAVDGAEGRSGVEDDGREVRSSVEAGDDVGGRDGA